ncbi:porin [Aromatoleum petrolei]|uniref:Porin n=1 Tax=Aromatoleum petrolei TaxID=76116 RepID=A0ABX1MJM3_9RHOO|nr:porin [Aromatoleum petrolei]NMF87396.1 porin [Aromatoleum petrolei]QTQ35763.1 putative outer membrane porin protein [Aromatoleum petrolei]
MQNVKTLAIALAAIGVAGAAQAQSNVTIYGRVNTSVEQTKVQGEDSATQVVNNASRFGFRGTEDLGNGLSALFQIETGFASDTGAGDFASRDSFVGLKGNLGTVKLGFITSPLYYATHDYLGMHNHDTGFSSDAFLWVPAYDPEKFFVRNSVTYASPTFGGGFTFEAQYAALNEQVADIGGNDANARNDNPSHYSATLSYDNGPLHVGFGYAQTNRFYNFDDGKSKDSALVLAGVYDFKTVVVGLLAEHNKSDNGGLQAITGLTGDHDRNHYRVAVMMPVGASEFHVNYGVAQDWSSTDDTGARQLTLAYNYNLSKRTKVYAQWTKIDNDKQKESIGNGGAYDGGGAYSFLGSGLGLDNTSFGVGLRHNF